MSNFDELNLARATLFQRVNSAVNNAAFGLPERMALNELLADPLAADHLLLARERLEGPPEAAMPPVTRALRSADAELAGVLAGDNGRDRRRAAIDAVDDACDALTTLLD